MWARLRVWVGIVIQKLRKYWWVGFTYAFWRLLEDRATNATNTWLDNHLPDAIKVIWNSMSFLPQSELGIAGWLFVFTILGIMIWAYVDTRDTHRSHREDMPLPLSPQDAANMETIKALFCSCGSPAYGDLQQLTTRFSDRLRGQGPEREMIATLASNHAFAPCNQAFGRMLSALKGPDKDNMNVLQQRLREFVKAYRNHVRWTHLIAPFSSPPLNEDPGYRDWREKHNLFRQELRVITVSDDFSQLREDIGGGWQDTVELVQ